jgi:hypothetical protein
MIRISEGERMESTLIYAGTNTRHAYLDGQHSHQLGAIE